MRAHFLRGFTPRETAPMVYTGERAPRPDADPTNWWSTRRVDEETPDCSVCRDSELHCITPIACGLATQEQIDEAQAVSSLHRIPLWLILTVIVAAVAGSALLPWGFAR